MGNPMALLTTLILLSSPIISIASEDGEPKFIYVKGAENGPEKWANLHSNYTICNAGKSQSPINLDDSNVQVTNKFGELVRLYKPAPAVIINQGHALQIKWTGNAGKIVINGTDFKLLQCHWHTPSENTVNGKSYDMELHLVHINERDELAALGIFFKIGSPDPFLEQLLEHIKKADRHGHDLGIIDPNAIRFGRKKYYRFIGSLTTPPCSQGVLWTIISKVRTVSQEQIDALKGAVEEGYKQNARPVQPLHGREVYLNEP